MRLLFVCTGNLCRSQIAEGLTAAWLEQDGARGQVQLLSAGTDAPVGRAMDPHSAAALAALGGDPAGRHARALTAELSTGADLVLTMTRRHRRKVLELAPRHLRRTFTLLEAAELARHADLRDLGGLPLGRRAHELGLRLHALRAWHESTESDDLLDPIGRRASVHVEVARTIDAALRPLLGALFSAPTQAAAAMPVIDLDRKGEPTTAVAIRPSSGSNAAAIESPVSW